MESSLRRCLRAAESREFRGVCKIAKKKKKLKKRITKAREKNVTMRNAPDFAASRDKRRGFLADRSLLQFFREIRDAILPGSMENIGKKDFSFRGEPSEISN